MKEVFRPTISFLILLLGFLLVAPLPAGALEQETAEGIDALVRTEMRSAKIGNVAAGVLQDETIDLFSWGDTSFDAAGLYQIGSISKSFTGLGIRILEERGLLSLSDTVAQHIPGFTVKQDGQTLPDESLTLADLLFQTSGFTNDERRYPRPKIEQTLAEGVDALSGLEVSALPGTRYAYANTNYILLGRVIETVTGESYQGFMEGSVFGPLGLTHTFATAGSIDDETVVPGSRVEFLRARPYEREISEGAIPAGYIRSNVADLLKWAQAHMGEVDVAPELAVAIKKSHLPDEREGIERSVKYASGWFVDDDGVMQHSGGTPNYSSKLSISASGTSAVAVLTNTNATVNTLAMADNILRLVEGNPVMPTGADIWTIIDTIFTVVTIVGGILSVLLLLALTRLVRKTRSGKLEVSARWGRTALYAVIPAVLLVATVVALVVIPSAFNSTWMDMHVWSPWSLYVGMLALIVFSVLFLIVAVIASRRTKGQIPDNAALGS